MSDGGTLCYGYDGEIYTQQPDATPKKVAIEIVRDDRPQFANLQSSDGATSAVVSPDGKQIAFTLRGEVFVTSADYATTKQVTHTPAREAASPLRQTTAPWPTPASEAATGSSTLPR